MARSTFTEGTQPSAPPHVEMTMPTARGISVEEVIEEVNEQSQLIVNLMYVVVVLFIIAYILIIYLFYRVYSINQ